jgi:oxygen-dependent protoporphyrinogen oxidase
LAGINAGDPEKISLRSAFPVLEKMERERGSVLRALRRSGISRTRAASFSFTDGNRALPLTLATSLGRSIALQSPVERIELSPEGVRVSVGGERSETVRARKVVVAAEASAAVRLVALFAADAAREIAAIEHAPVVQLALVYPRKSIGVPLDGFGFLATRDAGVRILGAVWNSVAFPKHSREDEVLITAIVGGAFDREVTAENDDDLVAIAHGDLRNAMKIDGAAPRVAAVFRWDPGIPQYSVGHEKRVQSIAAAMARVPSVALCGNYLSGVSVSDLVRQAREVAQRFSQSAF